MRIIFSNDGTRLLALPSTPREATMAENRFAPYVKNYKNNPRFRMGLWDGKKRYWNGGKLNIGLWNELFELCKEHDFPVEFEGKEYFPKFKVSMDELNSFFNEFFADHVMPDGNRLQPYEYQVEAVRALLSKRYSTIEVATAGGKSLIFSMFLFYLWKNHNPDMRALLIIPSKHLCTQFHDDLINYNERWSPNNPHKVELKITEMMSDKPRVYKDGVPNLVIGTYQSLAKKEKEFFESFDVVFADEAHSAVSDSLKYILENCRKSFWRCGMSGTYPDGTAEWMQVFSLLGPISYSISAKKLQELKVIAPIKIKIIELLHNDKEMGATLNSIKKRGGGKQAFELEKKYVHASKKRNDFLVDLVSKSERSTLVLFYTKEWGLSFWERCRTEIEGKAFYYIDGDIDNNKREYIKQQMEDNESTTPKVLIASYGTLSTGVSIKKISRIIFADSFKDQKLIRQSIGRGLRLHKDKTELVLIDIVDNISESYRKGTFIRHGLEREDIYASQGWEWEKLKLEI